VEVNKFAMDKRYGIITSECERERGRKMNLVNKFVINDSNSRVTPYSEKKKRRGKKIIDYAVRHLTYTQFISECEWKQNQKA
jgi:hypothetical protein